MPKVTYDSHYPNLIVQAGWKQRPVRDAANNVSFSGKPDPELPNMQDEICFAPEMVWALWPPPAPSPEAERVLLPDGTLSLPPVRTWVRGKGSTYTTDDPKVIVLLDRCKVECWRRDWANTERDRIEREQREHVA